MVSLFDFLALILYLVMYASLRLTRIVPLLRNASSYTYMQYKPVADESSCGVAVLHHARSRPWLYNLSSSTLSSSRFQQALRQMLAMASGVLNHMRFYASDCQGGEYVKRMQRVGHDEVYPALTMCSDIVRTPIGMVTIYCYFRSMPKIYRIEVEK
jgi:hypothetical protein